MTERDRDSLDASVWHATATAAPATESLSADLDCDVAIVGAGYSGLSTALHAQALGLSCVVLEAREIGWGASGRNTGWWAPVWAMVTPSQVRVTQDERVVDQLAALTVEAARLVPALVREHQIECSMRETGVVVACADDKARARVAARAAEWRKYGAAIDDLDAMGISAHVTSPKLLGGVHYRDGGMLNPLSLARGLARAAMSRGAKVFTNSPVSSVTRLADRWVVRAPAGQVTASRVLLATDAFTSAPWPRLAHSFLSVRVAMIGSAPFADHGACINPSGVPFTDAADTFGAGFDPDGRLVMSILPPFNTRKSPAAVAAPFWRRMRQFAPAAPADVGWDYAWYGDVGVSADKVVKAYTLAPNVFAVNGYSGNGITLAVIAGREMARHFSGVHQGDLNLPVQPLATVSAARLKSLLIGRAVLPLIRRFVYAA